MPKIEIYLNPVTVKGQEYRCDIHVGPGCHGVGATEAEALTNAALAWQSFERKAKK
jgi:hypothetical protein